MFKIKPPGGQEHDLPVVAVSYCVSVFPPSLLQLTGWYFDLRLLVTDRLCMSDFILFSFLTQRP